MIRLIGRLLLQILLILSLGTAIAACGSRSGFKDDELVGFVGSVDAGQGTITIDISEWAHRNDGPNQNDWGMEYDAKLSPETIILNEAGESVELADIRIGQNIRIYPPDTTVNTPDKLLILDMASMDKYKRMGLLAGSNGKLHTVVVSEQGAAVQYDSVGLEQEAPAAIEGGLSLMEYDPDTNGIIDIRQEFGIKSFPAFLVFDEEKLVYLTYKAGELQQYLSD